MHFYYYIQAIANLGGSLIDCNDLFCQFTGYSKQQMASQTIFSLTAKEDLQYAFDRISQWLTPTSSSDPPNSSSNSKSDPQPIILRSNSSANDKGRTLRMRLTPIKNLQSDGDDDNRLQHLCVTLLNDEKAAVVAGSPGMTKARYSPILSMGPTPPICQPPQQFTLNSSGTTKSNGKLTGNSEKPQVMAIG